MAIKKKSYEKLDDTNIKRVIAALTSENPITKKEACEMLNINYNTTRLSKIIEGFKEDQEYRKIRMSKNRGKPASKDEMKQMIEMYLDGQTITDISKTMFRSPAFIKGNLDKVGVPTRVAEGEKFIVPDEHFFFMGDNRDCSKDSRFLSSVGYVNFINLVGKSKIIFLSNDTKEGNLLKFWRWNKSIRTERFFNKIK